MIEIGGIPLHLYGLMIGLGVLVGGSISAWVAKREGVETDLVWDGLVWVMFFGVVGARAYHVIDYWSYYSVHLVQVVEVWRGGLGVYGGIIGGLVGIVIVELSNCRIAKNKKQVTLLTLLDIASFGVPVGQAIGRWGNYFNQELFGAPTSLPWGIYISPENRPVGMEQFSHFQPLFLYESLLSWGLFIVLVISYKKSIRQARNEQQPRWEVGRGKYLGMYLFGYGLIRMVLEPLRLRSWSVGVIPMAQLMSGVIIAMGIYLMVRKKRLTKVSNRQ